MTSQRTNLESPWPHRLAVLLVCATFPLIWVGGLVTTYDAGMAVPDWPSTYGYNLFAYPWQTWLFGPWDLFIEHGHRLLGALVGFIAIAFVVVVWRNDRRKSMRVAALGALTLVILQGALGGARVLLDERQLAMVHGCVGPAFFAYCVALAVFTSKKMHPAQADALAANPHRLQRLSLLTVVFAYLQLVIGAQLRHVSVMAAPGVFRGAVVFHLVMAVVVTIHIFLLLLLVKQQFATIAPLQLPVVLLAILVLVQVALGGAAWVVKYGWPEFLAEYSFAAPHTIQAKGVLQALIVTSHVATGSLILAVSMTTLARSIRLFRMPTVALGSGALMMELAT
ncbi:MAG: COX15/CtaA family protein [Planctomycetaceae bacterium]|nr:COX15/CtaA family protein [Planctomycetales bacterium]MCB9874744.1 COX15/CtaA family protein [Planctomycetaceae bacterium]HRX80151.1 COX15/CtaA family protein [Pirellulaceae bacterium]